MRRLFVAMVIGVLACSFILAQPAQNAPAHPASPNKLLAAPDVEVLSDTSGVDLTMYLSNVVRTIRKNWYALMPLKARAPENKQGQVSIEFSILKDGRVTGITVKSSSGDDVIDRAALGSVKASSPLSPLPSELLAPSLMLHLRFQYNPDKGVLDQKGQAAKEAADFTVPEEMPETGAGGSSEADQFFRRGQAAFRAKDYEAAARAWERTVELEPTHLSAWNWLCRADYELKKIEAAVVSCRKQIVITPDDKYAHNNLARALWAQGKLEEAEQEFRKQIAINPQDRWAHANLGLLLGEEKKCGIAIPELEAGLNIDAKNLKARDALRDCYQQTGQNRKAEQLAAGTVLPGPVIGGVISGDTLVAQDNQAPEGDYFNPDIGIKVHLPDGWRVVRQVKPSYTQPARAMVMKVGALATLVLAREHLESSAQMYRLLVERQLAKSADFEKTGADAISVDGVAGDRITYKFNLDKVELRGWVGFFSNGDEHYRMTALAPADIYDRYAPMYASMLRSVRFPWMHPDEKFVSTVPTTDVVQVLPEVAKGHLIRSIPPEYPPTARSARIQGTVVLAARISSTGDVEELKVISGHPSLIPAAIDAVKQWKYTPYTVNGEPVEVMTTIYVNFSLSG